MYSLSLLLFGPLILSAQLGFAKASEHRQEVGTTGDLHDERKLTEMDEFQSSLITSSDDYHIDVLVPSSSYLLVPPRVYQSRTPLSTFGGSESLTSSSSSLPIVPLSPRQASASSFSGNCYCYTQMCNSQECSKPSTFTGYCIAGSANVTGADGSQNPCFFDNEWDLGLDSYSCSCTSLTSSSSSTSSNTGSGSGSTSTGTKVTGHQPSFVRMISLSGLCLSWSLFVSLY